MHVVLPLVTKRLASNMPKQALGTLIDGINSVIGPLHFPGQGHNGYTKSTWKITERDWMKTLPPRLPSEKVSGLSGKHRYGIARVVGFETARALLMHNASSSCIL